MIVTNKLTQEVLREYFVKDLTSLRIMLTQIGYAFCAPTSQGISSTQRLHRS